MAAVTSASPMLSIASKPRSSVQILVAALLSLVSTSTKKGGSAPQSGLQTAPAGTADPGTWVDYQITLSQCGTLSVKYKGMDVFKDIVIGYTKRPGRWILGARPGGEHETHWIDDLTINTVIDTLGDLPPRVTSTLPAGNGATPNSSNPGWN